MKEREFTDEALAQFREAYTDSYDFARCQRPDGSFYGTSGTCRKGTKVGPREMKALKKAAAGGNARAAAALDVVSGKKTVAQAKAELGEKPKKKMATKKKVTPAAAAPAKEKPPAKPKKKVATKKKVKAEKPEDDKKKTTKKKATPKKKPEAKATSEADNDPQKQRDRLKTKKGRQEVDAETMAEVRRLERNSAMAPPDKDISPKAERSILNYTRDDIQSATGYKQMNNCARNPPSCSPETVRANTQLDSALRSAPNNRQGESLFRGMDLKDNPALAEQLTNLKPGDTFTDGGFGSYSRSMSTARGFLGNRQDVEGRNVVITTRSKKIRFIEEYSDFSSEQEGILPRGTSQTVRSVKNIGNTTYIEVD